MKGRLVGIGTALALLAAPGPGICKDPLEAAAVSVSADDSVNFPADYPVELPSPDVVRAALADAPQMRAALALLDAARAEGRQLAAGPHEWTARTEYRRRRVRESGVVDGFDEWSIALERGVRTAGKIELDRRLGLARIAEADVALADTVHEVSRWLLERWYAVLRAERSAQLFVRQAELSVREASAVTRRRALGDASLLDELQALAEGERAQVARQAAESLAERARSTLAQEFPALAGIASVRRRLENLPDPARWTDDLSQLVRAAHEHSHALRAAQAAADSARAEATRIAADRRPDPTVGVQYGTERSGSEHILGVFVSIPFGGVARQAAADAGFARAAALARDVEAQRRKVDAQLADTLLSVRSGVARWELAQRAAGWQASAAERIGRARELGEAGLAEVLQARRLALDAALQAESVRIDTLEARARLLLDAHRLWDFEPD